jgi:hypothetical protein
MFLRTVMPQTSTFSSARSTAIEPPTLLSNRNTCEVRSASTSPFTVEPFSMKIVSERLPLTSPRTVECVA